MCTISCWRRLRRIGGDRVAARLVTADAGCGGWVTADAAFGLIRPTRTAVVCVGRISEAHPPLPNPKYTSNFLLIIRQPDTLIRRQGQSPVQIRHRLPTDQIPPILCTDQIDIGQTDFLRPIAQVIQTENTLSSAQALPPETKHLRLQVQSELSSIRVKRRLRTANPDQSLQRIEDSVLRFFRVG